MSEVLIYGAHFPMPLGERNGKFIRFVSTKREFKTFLTSDNYSMIIIDLEGREKEGFSLAEYVRQIPRHCSVPILFFAKNRRLEKRAFHEIHCYDYFVKPLSNDDIIQIVYLCTRRMAGKNDCTDIVFPVNNDKYLFKMQDIYYLEANGKYVTVNTASYILDVPYLILDDFMGNYGEHFLRVHRAYVVNRLHIRCVDLTSATVELDNGVVLEVGRKYISGLRQEFGERPRRKKGRPRAT